jgi:outer membrane immunogenic protein
MKLLTSSIFTLLALGGGASAADLVLADTPMVPLVASVHDWSGFYAGVVAGYGTGVVDYSDIGLMPSADPTVSGGLIGGTFGYNAQFDTFVVGLEGDLAWSNLNGSLTSGGPISFGSTVDWIGTIRGRAGVAFDSVLLYATAGLATGGLTTTLSGAPGFTPHTDTHVGYTVGAGVEAALLENVTVKAEYAYTDLGSRTIPTGSLFALSTANTVQASFHAVKFGANFHF